MATPPGKDDVRRAVAAVPDGTYAVPDPGNPAVVTLWRIAGAQMTAWPPGRRWAPVPPPAPELRGPRRAAWREHWYDTVYWPWKAAVLDAIAADPGRAADEFDRRTPPADRPPPPYGDVAPRRGRDLEALEAIALYRTGRTLDDIAHALALPPDVALRRAQEGEERYDPAEVARAPIGLDAILRLADLRAAP